MYSLAGNLAMDLLLAINSKVVKEIPEITHWSGAKEISENRAEFCIYYGIPGKHPAFCELDISVTQYEKELDFEVFAEYENIDFGESELIKIHIDYIMAQYMHLRPIVTEGITHYFDSDENGKTNWSKPAESQTFKVRYRVIYDVTEEKEGSRDSYGFDKMANKAFPYIKSLHDIFQIVHLSHKNLESN